MTNNTLDDFLLFMFFPQNAAQPSTGNPELGKLRQKAWDGEASLNYETSYVASSHPQNQ